LIKGIDKKFEIGTGFYPSPTDDTSGGVCIGGGSLWMMANKPQPEQDAAWEFIKFVVSPPTQAYWNTKTGYFPISIDAQKESAFIENAKQYPQFKTALDQLHSTKLARATQGGLIGVFPQARQEVEKAIEETIQGSKPAKKALEDSAAVINKALETYNKTVK